MAERQDSPGTAAPGEPDLGEPASETAGEPAVRWPALPSGLPLADRAEARDRAVDAVLERLGALASAPVSGHAEAYEALHDELLEALNEDVAGLTPAGQGGATPAAAAPATATEQSSDRPGDAAR